MCRRFGLSAIALLCVTSLLVAGCSLSHGARPAAHATRTVSVKVDPKHAARLRLADGVQVDVPPGAVAGTGTLAGATTTAPAPAPPGLRFDGPTYNLHVAGTRITGTVTLRVPAPVPDGGAHAALLAYFDPVTDRWTPVQATYDPAASTLTTLTPHLSLWTTFTTDTAQLLASAKSLLAGLFEATGTADQPTCPRPTGGAVAKVTSSSGDIVKWCAGTDSAGRTLLRIANNRSYAIELDFPRAWSESPIGTADPVWDATVSAISGALSPTPRTTANVIVPGAHTIELTLPTGSSGAATVDPSSQAYLVSAFFYGVQTYAMTLEKLPWVKKPPKLSAAETMLKGVVGSGDCLRQMDSLLHRSVSDAGSVGELVRADVDLAVGCLEPQVKLAYGLSGVLKAFIVSTLLWLADGIKALLDAKQALADEARYFWQDYEIAVSPTRAPLNSATQPVSDSGVGPLRIGMTFAQAQAATSTPLTQRFDCPNDATLARWYVESGDSQHSHASSEDYPWFWADRGHLVEVSIGEPAPDWHTVAGIHTGSTLAAVKRAYPQAQPLSVPGNDEPSWEVVDGPNAMLFYMINGTVMTINAGQRQSVEAAEMCG